MATQLPSPRLVFLDANGNPLAGGIVHCYTPGTTTNKQTWQDQAGTIPNTQPVVLDSAGSALIFGSGSYQLTVTDSLGNAVPGYTGLTYDGGNSSLSNQTDAGQGAAQVGFLSSRANAVGRTVSARLQDWLTVKDFGAVGDGRTDDTAAINNAFAAGKTYGKTVIVPAGAYGVTDGGNAYCLLNTGASIKGENSNTSVIFPLPSTASGADILAFRPPAGDTSVSFDDFMIYPARSGTAYGKRAIYMDFSTAGVAVGDMHMANVYCAAGNDYSLYSNNVAATNPQGVPANTVIERCAFYEGVNLQSIGDSCTFRNNVVRSTPGTGRSGILGLIVSTVGAGIASHFIIEKCNIGTDGPAIWILNGRNVKVLHNNIEQSYGNGSSSGAVIDIDGTSGAVIMPEIKGNAVSIFGTATAANAIRVNAAFEADIDNNTIIAGQTTSCAILLTGNANNTIIGLNEISSSYTTPINNNGVGTRGVRIALSLISGFSNVGGGYAPASYWQTREGVVLLEGLLSCPASPNAITIATLPVAARPPTARSFPAHAVVSGAISPQAIILSSAGVLTYSGSNSATQVSLDGINFATNTGITGGL